MTLLLMITISLHSMVHGVNPQLVESIIEVESKFNPDMTGSIGEIGLMQIRKEYWQGPLNLYNPEMNIGVGISMLAKLKKLKPRLGEYYYVAWNLGPTGAIKYSKKKKLKQFSYAKKTDLVYNKKVLLASIN